MRDIIELPEGSDMKIQDSIVPKAANLMGVQIGSLEYAQDFGVDLDYFLNNPIVFQNEAFKAYLIQKLAQHLINVTEVVDIVDNLFETLQFRVSPNEQNEGMIR